MIVTNFGAELDSIPQATAQQHADARAYVTEHAPDLLEAIFGSDA